MVINDNIHILLQSSPGNVWLIRLFRYYFSFPRGQLPPFPPQMTPLRGTRRPEGGGSTHPPQGRHFPGIYAHAYDQNSNRKQR